MKLKTLAVIALPLMALAACAPKHIDDDYAKYDPSHSKAMNIALFTGLTTPNGPLVDSKPVKKDGSSKGVDSVIGEAAMANLLYHQASGTLLDLGMSQTGSMSFSGLGLVSSLLTTTYQPEWNVNILVFMPKDLAKDEEDATHKLAGMVKSFNAVWLPKGATKISSDEDYTSDFLVSAYTSHLNYTSSVMERRIFNYIKKPEISTVKGNWISTDSFYYWSYMATSSDPSPYIISWDKHTSKLSNKQMISENEKMSVDYYYELSKYMPVWFYIYCPPHFLNANSPALFLNQGKALLFVKP